MANIATLTVSLTAKTTSFEKGIKKVQNTTLKFQKKLNEDTAGGKQVKKGLSQVDKGAQRVRRAVGGAFAAGGIVAMVKGIAGADTELKSMRTRLNVLGGESITFKELGAAAERAGVPMQDMANLTSRLLTMSGNLGISNETVLEMSENFFKLGRIAGTTTQEMRSAALQFAQGFGSGRLQGEELRAIFESMPLLAQRLADELNVPIGQLKEMGKAGSITPAAMARALTNAKSLEAQIAVMPATVDTVNAKLGDSTKLLAAAVGLGKFWTSTIEGVSDAMDFVTGRIEAHTTVEGITARIERLQGVLKEVPAGTLLFKQITGQIQQAQDKLLELEGQAKASGLRKPIEKGEFFGTREGQRTQFLIDKLQGKKGIGVSRNQFGVSGLGEIDAQALSDLMNRTFRRRELSQGEKKQVGELKEVNKKLAQIFEVSKTGPGGKKIDLRTGLTFQ